MKTEIERKFLLDKIPDGAFANYNIEQGFLSTDPDRIVRIRLMKDALHPGIRDAAYITIKSKTENSIIRNEYEYRIPREDAEELIKFCIYPVIKKTRYGFTNSDWEIDVFKGDLEGLILAEIEMRSVDEVVKLPVWANNEVTDKFEYTNAGMVDRLNKEHNQV